MTTPTQTTPPDVPGAGASAVTEGEQQARDVGTSADRHTVKTTAGQPASYPIDLADVRRRLKRLGYASSTTDSAVRDLRTWLDSGRTLMDLSSRDEVVRYAAETRNPTSHTDHVNVTVARMRIAARGAGVRPSKKKKPGGWRAGGTAAKTTRDGRQRRLDLFAEVDRVGREAVCDARGWSDEQLAAYLSGAEEVPE